MFTLRFPFELPPGQEIGVDDTPWNSGGLEFSLSRRDTLYVLTVRGFSSEAAAREYVPTLWAGLMWVQLHRGLAFQATRELQDIHYAADPVKAAENLSKSLGVPVEGKLDALIDGRRPAVFASDKVIRTITTGGVTVKITTPAADVARFLAEGLALPGIAKCSADDKLLTAVDLYGAYYVEVSRTARFLTLVMALEALAEGQPRPPRILALLDRWREEADTLEKAGGLDPAERASLEAVKRELVFRRQDSIRVQIRSVVEAALNSVGEADATDTAGRAVKIYDQRSTLVHEGRLPPQELAAAMEEARTIVERVLRARFRQP